MIKMTEVEASRPAMGKILYLVLSELFWLDWTAGSNVCWCKVALPLADANTHIEKEKKKSLL